MYKNLYQVLLAVMLTCMFFTACKKWDDHNALTDPLAGKDLFQQISENAELSRFAELLTKSGYDKVIASSKTFTVFAPSNTALASLDPAVVADTARLRLFVTNHITNQLYQTAAAATGVLRLQMLNGKYNNLQNNKFGDATIVDANKYAKNGYLHIMDKMVPFLPNAWEFLENNPLVPAKQKAYMLSLFRNVFDATNAEQIGIDPTTGRPIYKPGTDSVRTNVYWRDVHDLRNENKQYTFFLLTDNAWDAEGTKFRPFYATGTADSTANLSNWAIARDLAVEGLYEPASLPDTIVSKNNVKVGIDKSAIVQSVKVSNGIVYILNRLDVRPKDKFQQYIIEAENYNFSSADRRGNTYFRDRFNTLTGKEFRDVLVFNHGLPQFNLGYRLNGVPALKFRVYWVALHDNINSSTATFTQKLGIGTPLSTTLPYITVGLNDYNEIYVGEFTMSAYSPFLNIYLTAANTTMANTNAIVCDYIRLEPVL